MNSTYETRVDYDLLQLSVAQQALVNARQALAAIDLRTYRADPVMRDEIYRMRNALRSDALVLGEQIQKLQSAVAS